MSQHHGPDQKPHTPDSVEGESPPKPSSRARMSIMLIGVGFFTSIICMCVAVFALASL
jgi:hypothetical protein